MKRRLFLLRHAKSSWDDLAIPDHDRPLNKRGRKAAIAMRQFIRAAKIKPDLVCVSSARRTMQTLEALAPWRRPPPVEVMDELYLASAQKIMELARGFPDSSRAVLVIGHNPGLQEFALLLASGKDDALVLRMAQAFPTGAMAQFEIDCPWSQIDEGLGQLTSFVAPRGLKSP